MIDLQQFVCEVVLSLLLVAIYLKVGLGFEMVMLFISFSLLFSLSLIDLRYKAVPDSLNLLALFFAIFSTVQSYEIVQNLHYATVFAGGFVLLRFCVSYFKKQEAMGEADIIVAATMGAILHLKLALFAIFLSAILAIVAMAIIYKKDFALPFIPFLSLALFITYLYEDTIYKVLGAIYG
jgi:leader peptidase (prepilin peptidase)/N-methyltransferase